MERKWKLFCAETIDGLVNQLPRNYLHKATYHSHNYVNSTVNSTTNDIVSNCVQLVIGHDLPASNRGHCLTRTWAHTRAM